MKSLTRAIDKHPTMYCPQLNGINVVLWEFVKGTVRFSRVSRLCPEMFIIQRLINTIDF
jgi:hypothetical protein